MPEPGQRRSSKTKSSVASNRKEGLKTQCAPARDRDDAPIFFQERSHGVYDTLDPPIVDVEGLIGLLGAENVLLEGKACRANEPGTFRQGVARPCSLAGLLECSCALMQIGQDMYRRAADQPLQT